jgi:hypothetical protein
MTVYVNIVTKNVFYDFELMNKIEKKSLNKRYIKH